MSGGGGILWMAAARHPAPACLTQRRPTALSRRPARPLRHPPALALMHQGAPPAQVASRLLDLQGLAYAQAGLLDATPQQEGGLR